MTDTRNALAQFYYHAKNIKDAVDVQDVEEIQIAIHEDNEIDNTASEMLLDLCNDRLKQFNYMEQAKKLYGEAV